MAIENHDNPIRETKPDNTRSVMGACGPEEEEEEEEENQWPPWLIPLLKENFFVQCSFHEHSPKSECKMYCLDCNNGSLCSLCLAHHKDHRTLQIRKSSYHHVIKVNEIHKHLDVSSVQTYVINSAKVVFLNERPQARPCKVFTSSACQVCFRCLVDDCFSFCSLGCKVAGSPRSMEKIVKNAPMESQENSSNSSEVDNNTSKLQSSIPSTPQLPISGSMRKRRRKGIPYQSPWQ